MGRPFHLNYHDVYPYPQNREGGLPSPRRTGLPQASAWRFFSPDSVVVATSSERSEAQVSSITRIAIYTWDMMETILSPPDLNTGFSLKVSVSKSFNS